MKYIKILVFLLLSFNITFSQEVIIEGNLKITQVENVDSLNIVLTIDENGEILQTHIDTLIKRSLSCQEFLIKQFLSLGVSPLKLFDDGVPASCLLGQFYEGGHIIYLDTLDLHPGFKGLVAGQEDIGMADWGCIFTDLPGAEASGIGDGEQNTADALAGCSEGDMQTRLADDWISNGFEDWYLPNLVELQLIHDELFVNGITSFGTAGFAINYGTSEENSNNPTVQHKLIQITTNITADTSKTQPSNVRAVRKF